MNKPLTAAAVAKYRPAGGRRTIRDAGARSLYLVISESGAKSWMMRFRDPNGHPRKIVLGAVDLSGHELAGDPVIGAPLTLAGARALTADIHRRRERGEDIFADHKAHKAARQLAAKTNAAKSDNTFAAAARDYIVNYRLRPPHPRAGQWPRRWRDSARLLGLDFAGGNEPQGEPKIIKGGLAETWGKRDVREIGEHEVWAMIRDVKERGVPGLVARNSASSEARARHLHDTLSGLFSWLRKERRVTVNPCREMDRPAAGGKRERHLSSDEVRLFWLACDQVGEPFGTIFKLLLLSGARLREVAGMRGSELSDDAWNLPGRRTKNGRPLLVPLTPLLRQLIASVPRQADTDLLFTTTGSTPVSGWSNAKRRLDALMLAMAKQERGSEATCQPWRLHDLRRTAVTGMITLGVAPHVVELVVNHVSGAKAGVAGVYNHAEMLPERRAALERWGHHVSGIVERTANVVNFPRQSGT